MLKLSKYPLHLFGALEYVSNKGIDHREELILFLFVWQKDKKVFCQPNKIPFPYFRKRNSFLSIWQILLKIQEGQYESWPELRFYYNYKEKRGLFHFTEFKGYLKKKQQKQKHHKQVCS